MKAAAWLMAFTPRAGFEEWAARPWNTTSHRTTPLVATTTRISVGSATTLALRGPPASGSGIESHSAVTPRKRYSSSIAAASQTSQGGAVPDSARSATAWSIPASPAFVSQEPRPYIRPPSITGSKGGIVIPAVLTTSMWASRTTRREGSRPRTTPTTLSRPGRTVVRRDSMPRVARNAATKSATPASPGPPNSGLTLSMRTRAARVSTTGEGMAGADEEKGQEPRAYHAGGERRIGRTTFPAMSVRR